MRFRSAWIVSMLAVIWLATPSTASAQVGFLVGLNSTNLKFDTDDIDDEDPDRRLGLVAGLSFNVPIQDVFSVEVDALFSQKGAKFSEPGFTQKIKLNYLDFPVMGRINLPGSGPVGVHLLAGPSFNFKLGEKFEEDGEEIDNDEDQVERLETTLVVGGGVHVSRFRVDLRYGIGLSNIGKDSGSDKVKNRVFSILVGFGG